MGLGAKNRKETPTGVEAPVVPELADAKAAATALDGPEHDAEGKDGVLPGHTFALDFTDLRGRQWTGQFRCHVLTYRQQIQVGLLRARLSGGVPPDALDAYTANLLEIVAHLTICLDEAPPWAQDLMDLYDATVANAIYAEVADHKDRFHGSGSGGSSADADARPVVSDGTGVVPKDG